MKLSQALLIAAVGLGCVGEEALKSRSLPSGYSGSFKTWWSDTQIREQGQYERGVRHGQVTVFHPDGTVESVGTYDQGLPVGEMRYHSPGGALRLVEIVHDGVLDGPREDYDKAGTLRVSVPFRAGRRQGVEQRWHANGTLSTEGSWSNDLPTSQWRHWDGQGRQLSVERFWVAEGRAVGYFESTFDPATGRVTAQSLKTLDDGAWSGWRTFWHDNGVQSGLIEYVDGLRQGRDVSWDRQGRLSVEGQREGDLRSGVWRYWDDSGELLDERVYVRGELLEELLDELADEASGG